MLRIPILFDIVCKQRFSCTDPIRMVLRIVPQVSTCPGGNNYELTSYKRGSFFIQTIITVRSLSLIQSPTQKSAIIVKKYYLFSLSFIFFF